MRQKTSLLGLGFMTPALVMVLLFFLIPVVLTGVFAFTNMSTATGISGGDYMITPQSIRHLADNPALDTNTIEALGTQGYHVGEASLKAAAEAGVSPAFLAEIGKRLDGKSFKSNRDFVRALKKLRSRPRSMRDLKLAAEPFSRSILNQRFATKEAFLAGLAALDLSLDAGGRDLLAKEAYTGWSWTTENFRTLVNKPGSKFIILNTIFYVATTLVLFNIGFALFLAVTTFYLPQGQATFFRAVWLLPRISPPVLYVLLWKWLLWDNGFLSTLTGWFGVAPFNYMLGSVSSAWTAVILINGFIGASMGMLIFSSALNSIPASMLHASEVDGASRWQQIRHIILPQLRWPILFVTSYQTLSLLTSFQEILLSTDGGPGGSTTVWSLEAYFTALNNYAGNLQYGYGASMALVLVIVGILLSLLYLRVFKFNELVAKPRIEN
ncbi:sugar ABC transporter permease [uncultured Cohaesibacter sp.]|uniref:carbohydrate ABC transporter permease n=1 Tax=uncultured Cohaesibacter sp. TaxID=1002546 RepID=UPI0029C77213|nr:sugar ABC transporter permease [uncultured Cohaesibacter sp.]